MSLLLPLVVWVKLFLPRLFSRVSSPLAIPNLEPNLFSSTAVASGCITYLLVLLLNDEIIARFSLASVLRPFLKTVNCPRKLLFCLSSLPIVFLIKENFWSCFLAASSSLLCLSNSAFSSFLRLMSLASSSDCIFCSCLAIAS